MKRRFINKISILLFGILVAVLLGGCALFESVNLTSEQSDLVAEYAAGKLLQYEKGHENGIEQVKDLNFDELNPNYLPEEEEELFPVSDLEDNPFADPVDSESDFNDDGSVIDEGFIPEDAVIDPPVVSSKSISEVLGIEGAEVVFDRTEECNKYPNDDGGLYLSMKATQGKKLLITHFYVENSSDEDVNVFTNSDDFKVRISVNGGSKVRGDVTLLDNDLMNFSNIIPAHGAVDGVFVFEINEDLEISTLDLILMDSENAENVYRLIG